MNILKLYMKIAKAQKTTILTYVCIFTILFLAFAVFSGESSEMQMYKGVKSDIALIDHDGSKLSNNLTKFIATKANIKDIETTDMAIKDALFYGDVTYVVEIPKGFEESFLKDGNVKLITQQKPDDANGMMVDRTINAYLQNMKSYQNLNPKTSIDSLHQQVSSDLKVNAQIQMVASEQLNRDSIVRNSFYNYLAYILTVIIIMVVGLTMHSIFASEIRKRNLVSPMSSSKMNVQLVLANLLFGILVWSIFTIAIMIVKHDNMFNAIGAIYILNSFIFTLCCISLAFMIVCLVTNMNHAEDVMNGVTNVIGLGSAFICGAFVPQAMMSDSVLTIGSFFPTFWYVKLNDMLSSISDLSQDMLTKAGTYMGIQLLFAFAFLVVALVIMKQRRSVDSITDSAK